MLADFGRKESLHKLNCELLHCHEDLIFLYFFHHTFFIIHFSSFNHRKWTKNESDDSYIQYKKIQLAVHGKTNEMLYQNILTKNKHKFEHRNTNCYVVATKRLLWAQPFETQYSPQQSEAVDIQRRTVGSTAIHTSTQLPNVIWTYFRLACTCRRSVLSFLCPKQ